MFLATSLPLFFFTRYYKQIQYIMTASVLFNNVLRVFYFFFSFHFIYFKKKTCFFI